MRLRDFDSLREESAFASARATETFRSVTKSETFQFTMDTKMYLIVKDPSIQVCLLSSQCFWKVSCRSTVAHRLLCQSVWGATVPSADARESSGRAYLSINFVRNHIWKKGTKTLVAIQKGGAKLEQWEEFDDVLDLWFVLRIATHNIHAFERRAIFRTLYNIRISVRASFEARASREQERSDSGLFNTLKWWKKYTFKNTWR